MKKKYFIYWKTKRISGNIILNIDWEKGYLDELIRRIINDINKKDPTLGIQNLEIPFMMELK